MRPCSRVRIVLAAASLTATACAEGPASPPAASILPHAAPRPPAPVVNEDPEAPARIEASEWKHAPWQWNAHE